MIPAERLESVLQETLTRPDLHQEDREALEKAILVVRTFPRVGSVKRDLVVSLLSHLQGAEETVQGIITGEHGDLEEEERGAWKKVSEDLQTTITAMEKKRRKP